jgi:hypothetical protein
MISDESTPNLFIKTVTMTAVTAAAVSHGRATVTSVTAAARAVTPRDWPGRVPDGPGDGASDSPEATP